MKKKIKLSFYVSSDLLEKLIFLSSIHDCSVSSIAKTLLSVVTSVECNNLGYFLEDKYG